MNNTIKAIPAKSIDVREMVVCHLESFEGFFLSFLGENFLELLYREILKSDTGFGVVIKESDQIVGFAIGTTDTAGLYRRLIFRRLLRFFFYSLGALIRKPSIISRLFRALFMARSSSSFSSRSSLMSIAIKKKFQGKGVGSILLNSFLLSAKSKGADDLFLTTDSENNEATNFFYLKNGFVLKRQFLTPEGRKMNEYYYKFL